MSLIKLITLFLIVLLLPHILSFNNSYVEIERFYIQPAIEIAQHGFGANLSQYFTYTWSPALTSIILALSYWLFGGESPLLSRVTIFAIAFIFVLFLYWYLRKKKGTWLATVTSLLVIVNPLFIIYSQYVCTDVPFMAFASISMLLLLYSCSLREKVASAIMLGFAFATKYTAVVLFPVVAAYSFMEYGVIRLKSVIRFNAWYFGLVLLVALPVVVIAYRFLDSILPMRYGGLFIPDVSMYIPRLFAYLLWLGIFAGAFSLVLIFDLWKRMGGAKFLWLLASLVAVTLVVTYYFPISSLHRLDDYFGEMNLAGLEMYVAEPYLSVGLFPVLIIAELLVIGMVSEMKRNKEVAALFYWVVIPIILMAMTRAAQRYMLMVLVPSSLYMGLVGQRVYQTYSKPFVLASLVGHCAVYLGLGFLSVN